MSELVPWIAGEVPAEARGLGAAWPAIVLTALFVLGLPVFAVRCFLHGIPRDRETLERGATVLVGYFLRHYFFWLVRPVFKLVLDSGVPAVALTGLSVLLGAASGIAVGTGHFALGGWLFLFAGMLDALDGRLARARGEATPAGAAIDSILDRYTDSFLLCGLAWYYRDGWVLLAVLGALVGSALVPYVRARGESLGVPIRVGVMQRVERVLVLGGTVALSPLADPLLPADVRGMHWLAVLGITVTAVTSNSTAASRFRALVAALGAPSGAKRPSAPRPVQQPTERPIA